MSKVFIVDAISQERKKKSKIRDTLLGYIILPTLSPNFTKIDGISAENKLRSELKPKHLTRKSDLDFLGPSVLSYTNAFPFTLVKAVTQSYWSKPFDTALLVDDDAC